MSARSASANCSRICRSVVRSTPDRGKLAASRRALSAQLLERLLESVRFSQQVEDRGPGLVLDDLGVLVTGPRARDRQARECLPKTQMRKALPI